MEREHANGAGADWDAIVVGSGMGGMVTAAALARTGKKCLLLERSPALGGQTHSFTREGFSWDVGLHYLSGFGPGESNRAVLDGISDTPIEMASTGAVYDTLHIGDAEPLQLSRPAEAQKLDLLDRFPDERAAIDGWFEAIRDGNETLRSVLQSRSLPAPFGTALRWMKRRSIQRWCGRTTAEVANELTDNAELATVLSAQWGDFGGRPSQASFALHATIVGSYLEGGGRYPAGGASAIAEHILPTILEAGGDARAGVTVESILLEDGRAVGVHTPAGDFRADVVVSDIGARETIESLLPEDHGADAWAKEICSLEPTLCHFGLFLGFSGDIEAAGATRSNHWLYPTGQTDAVWTCAPGERPPAMFLSFESLKDPDHVAGPDQRYAGQLVAWADWSSVAEWADRAPGERGADYARFKERVTEALLAELRAAFPRVADLIVYHELSTPLTTVDYTGHEAGGFYGLEVTPKRMLSDALVPRTPIEGLYLTGQDVATPGVPGAMWGGLFAAASIDPKVWMQLR